MLQKFYKLGCEVWPHLPYSPDLSPTDYHVFKHLHNFLQEKCFHKQEAESAFQEFTESWSTNFYATGINKLVGKHVLTVMVPILINNGVFEPSYNDSKFMVWSQSYFFTNLVSILTSLCEFVFWTALELHLYHLFFTITIPMSSCMYFCTKMTRKHSPCHQRAHTLSSLKCNTFIQQAYWPNVHCGRDFSNTCIQTPGL